MQVICTIGSRLAFALAATARLACPSCGIAGESPSERPNLVLIVSDNQGAWSLGCHGNPDIRTPNLDRMAADGVRFRQAFASNPVCSPTRATLLSGLMPSQHGVHNYLEAAYDTLEEFDTLPEILGRAGYTCGIVGKWHLGPFDQPGQEGFSHWVVKQGGHTASFYKTLMIDDRGEKQTVETHVMPLWTRHAVEFVQRNRDKPFFLYLAYNGPYGLSTCIRGEPTNHFAATYAGNEMKSFPREPLHPWLRTNREHVGNAASMRNYASQVSLVDEGVGEVLAALKDFGIDEQTLVVFTADQGMAGGHGGFWGMGDHTRPRTMYDWTLHVPLIVRHPGKVPADRTVDHLVANYDILPSLLSYLGLAHERPAKPRGPGRDFSPLLRGEAVSWESVVFGEYLSSVRMVRTDRWKLLKSADGGPCQLFELANDPGESNDLYGHSQHAAAQQQLERRLDRFFDEYSQPLWNMWQPGGTSKHLHTKQRPQGIARANHGQEKAP